MNNILLTEYQRKTMERNERICERFCEMQGAVGVRVEIISREFNISTIRVRDILKRKNLVGWKRS